MGGGGGKGVGTTWPDVKQSGAGGTLTPADRHGSVQVSLLAHLFRPSSLSCYSLDFPEASPFFLTYFASLLVSYLLPTHLQFRGRNVLSSGTRY